MRYRLIGLVAVIGLVLASCGGGTPEAAGPSEGIQVHGDWIIDIYNEDGSLDQHVEFSNALTAQGAEHLVRGLAGIRTMSGVWEITLNDTSSVELCPSEGFGCTFSGNPVTVFQNEILQLSGSTSVEADGVIDQVITWTFYCPVTVAPSECDGSGQPIIFTTKDITEPVSSGQTVQVQVDISFTSG